MNPTEIPPLQAAVNLYSSGRYDEALTATLRLVCLQPGDSAALNIAAACARALGRQGEAESYWLQAIRFAPNNINMHNNLGILYQDMKRFDDAEACYRRALAIWPHFAKTNYNLGYLFQLWKRFPEARQYYEQAIALDPNYVEAHNNLGATLQTLKLFPEAQAAYEKALAVCPDFSDAHNNLGNMHLKFDRRPEAEASYRRALAIRPDFADAHYNLGKLLYRCKRFPEAEMYYRRALAIRPEYVEAHGNLGAMFHECKRLPEAQACYRRALAICPEFADTRFNLAMLLLFLGHFDEGWPLYETRLDMRWKDRICTPTHLTYPQWKGEDLHGKSIVIWPEQGLGDEIQFIRYVPVLKTLGAARVTVVCRSSLKTLFERVAGADHVMAIGDSGQLAAHDFWICQMSLPLYCKTMVAQLPYLVADPERIKRWQPRLPTTGIKIGLAWRGSASHKNDASRSLPGLRTLAPLWSVAGVSFISLQKGNGEEEAMTALPGQPLVHVGSEIHDFADTAALVSQLDLVICVDTALAHLAGALGKRCWVLLPYFGTDWRWMDEREDCPWYPGVMRLFRQPFSEDWGVTISQMVVELCQLVDSAGEC